MKLKRLITDIQRTVCLLPAVVLATGCINEDRSDCGGELTMQYRTQPALNLRDELQAELTTAEERQMAQQLEARLADIFTTRMSRLEVSFFHAGPANLAQHTSHEVHSDEAEYTFTLVPGSYEHQAVAYTDAPGMLHTAQGENYRSLTVEQAKDDTIDSHPAGLFCGHIPVSIEGAEKKLYTTTLTMQNAAAVLVLHHSPSVSPVAIRTYVRDMAVAFCPSDSSFSLKESPVVRTHQLGAPKLTACYAVSFPSADGSDGTSRRSGTSDAHGSTLWRMEVYVTMPDGKTAKNTLSVSRPLKAGTLRVLKGWLDNKGELITDEKDVGVSVQLEWQDGGDHDVNM